MEPKGFLYPLIVGVVLSAVIVAVGIVVGKFSPTLPEDWENGKLVILDSGERFLTKEGKLHPVSNITSARLLSDPATFSTIKIGSDALAQLRIPRGREVGINGIPDDIPPVARLRADIWTSCVDEDATTHTWVAGSPEDLADAGYAIVRNLNERYLIVAGKRYLIDGKSDETLNQLFPDGGTAVHEVKAEWLNLFERGSDLEPFTIANAGDEYVFEGIGKVTVGSLLRNIDNNGFYLVVGDKNIVSLSDVQYRIYTLTNPNEPNDARSTDLASLNRVANSADQDIPQDWPQSIPTQEVNDNQYPCVSLKIGEKTEVKLTFLPPETPLTNYDQINVTGGYGALLRASTGTTGAVRLITDSGKAYGLGEDPQPSFDRFKYAAANVIEVPGAWVQLVPLAEEQLTPEYVLGGN